METIYNKYFNPIFIYGNGIETFEKTIMDDCKNKGLKIKIIKDENIDQLNVNEDVFVICVNEKLKNEKERQEQVLHIFNKGYEAGKSYIFLSNNSLGELKGKIQEELRCRFNWGVVLKIE